MIAPDTAAPTITLNGTRTVSLVQDGKYMEEGATCTDDTDENPILTIDDRAVKSAMLGNYTVTYTCIDASDNEAQATRTVEVIAPDTDAPIITLNGSSEVFVLRGAAYIDAGAECRTSRTITRS